jgi:hypothetical protein
VSPGVWRAIAEVPVELTAILPLGTIGATYSWTFGDSSTATTPGPSTNHTYASPGLYAIGLNVSDTVGIHHDDTSALSYLQVLPGFSADATGAGAGLSGSFLANSTNSSGASGVIRPGQWVSGSVWVTNSPTAPGVTLGVPEVTSDSPSITTVDHAQPNGTVSFTATTAPSIVPGFYEVTCTIPSVTSTGTVANSYEFGLYVGTGEVFSGPAIPIPAHRHTFVEWDNASAPPTMDPAIQPSPTGAELFRNVFQTLILPNTSTAGSAPGDYLPELAACVPGGTGCQAMFGSTLVSGDSVTFVVTPNPWFFDPITRHAWPVYPTDVLYSIARELAFADRPTPAEAPGALLAESLLPGPGSGYGAANSSWDGGLHAPYNTTPQMILDSMVVNGTECPTVAMSAYHGCITFDLASGGSALPIFLDLLASAQAASILSCGWSSAAIAFTGFAGIPYWSQYNSSGPGDHPCALPGTGPWGVPIDAMPATGWDAWELGATGGLGEVEDGELGTLAVGSGLYYLAQFTPEVSATIVGNPGFTPNPACTSPGCPTKVNDPSSVQILYSQNVSSSLAAIANGSASVAVGLPGFGSDYSSAVSGGSGLLLSTPSATTSGFDFNMAYNASALRALTGSNWSLPVSAMTDLAFRQFLAHAFPYTSVQQQVSDQAEYQTAFATAGPLPRFIGPGPATNVSWPQGSPDPDPSDVGGAAWWWSLAASDPLVGAACTATVPCTFPIAVAAGDGQADAEATLWAGEISNLSGGALLPAVRTLPLATLLAETLGASTGEDPFPIAEVEFTGTYADPSDYANAMWDPTGAYGTGFNVATGLGPLDGSGCPDAPGYWSNLSSPIPQGCQGAAVAALEPLLVLAQGTALGPARDLAYTMAGQVAEGLALEAGTMQLDSLTLYASWVGLTSVGQNPLVQGSGTEEYWQMHNLPSSGFPAPLAHPPRSELTAAPSGSEVGAPFGLVTTVVGATGTLAYNYTGLPAGCASASASSLTCDPAQSGQFLIEVSVRTGGILLTRALVWVPVEPAPSVSAFTAAPASPTAGSVLYLNVTVAGGIAPYRFVYFGLPTNCSSENLSSLSCVPTGVGVFAPEVRVTDADGDVATASVVLNLQQAPPSHPTGPGPNNSSGPSGTVSIPPPAPSRWWAILFLAGSAVAILAGVWVYRSGSSSDDAPTTAPAPTGPAPRSDPEDPEPAPAGGSADAGSEAPPSA